MRTPFLCASALLALFVADGAFANPARVTRGDAEALLYASGSGGWSVRLRSPVMEGAPADLGPEGMARIAPPASMGRQPLLLARLACDQPRLDLLQ